MAQAVKKLWQKPAFHDSNLKGCSTKRENQAGLSQYRMDEKNEWKGENIT